MSHSDKHFVENCQHFTPSILEDDGRASFAALSHLYLARLVLIETVV